MDTQEYINKLYVELNYLCDAFCNGAEKCKTNEEAYEFLREWYYENIVAYNDFIPYVEDDEEQNEAAQVEAERYMFSMVERVIKDPSNSGLNKKCVRFLRYFCSKMYKELFISEEEMLNWEHDNMWLGI